MSKLILHARQLQPVMLQCDPRSLRLIAVFARPFRHVSQFRCRQPHAILLIFDLFVQRARSDCKYLFGIGCFI